MNCEPFAASCVRPGWVCCTCRHYNPWDQYQCWKCPHQLCLIAPTPIMVGRQGTKDYLKREMHLAFSIGQLRSKTFRHDFRREGVLKHNTFGHDFRRDDPVK